MAPPLLPFGCTEERNIMKTLKTLGFASLALALVAGACERREMRTGTRKETTTTPTPAPSATDTTATADRVPSTLDERQPVSGTESTVPAATGTAPATTTTTTTTTSELYYVGADGSR